MTNPPGSAPDETHHYVKALGVGQFQPLGRAAPVGTFEGEPRRVREFTIPTDLLSTRFACNAFQPAQSSGCLRDPEPAGFRSVSHRAQATTAGTYQPYPYVLPGLSARLATGPMAALRLARLGGALIGLALIALAVGALWDESRPGYALAGLLLAVTPMVLFLAASVNPNGPEIAGAVCCLTGLLRLARPEEINRRGWLAAGAGGFVLAVSRTTGPLWLALILFLFLSHAGVKGTVDLVRRNMGSAAVTFATVAIGVALSVGWELRFQAQPQRPATEGLALLPSFTELPRLLREAEGVFGWLDTSMSSAAYIAWTIACIVLVVLASLVGTRRQRWVMAGTCAGLVVTVVLFSALALRSAEVARFGRYFLPVAVAVPLYAGEVLRANHARLGPLSPRHLIVWLAGLIGAVHAVALYANGRRHAVGVNGPLNYLTRHDWAPPGGWPLWAVVVLTGSLAMSAFGVAATIVDRRHKPEL